MEDQGAAAATGDTSSTPTPVASSSRKRTHDKNRKKDPKLWDNMMKTVSTMDESDKLAYIEEKYRDMYDEAKKLSATYQQLKKQHTVVQKERTHSQAELAKSMVARARLENLCRELQKQNKQIKEENIAKIKEEEERRKEISQKFSEKLTDINNMMDDNKDKSDKLREENLKMTAKLADLYNQFQKREEDILKMSHQLDLERQFSQATLAKMELEIQAEKQMHVTEQALMKSNLEKSEANCAVLLETVKGLQDHIDVYKGQYDDFENTMSKSTRIFDNFKSEIARMTKQVSSLEKEAQTWKTKFQDSMKALVEVSELKKNQDLYLQSIDKKNEQLNKLCRQLQSDRSNYLKLLKSHGIEPTPSSLPEKFGEAEVRKTDGPKMTKKEKELHLLKENLKAVQDELSRLSVEETEKKTENQASQVVDEDAKSVSGTSAQSTEVPNGVASKQEPVSSQDNPDPAKDVKKEIASVNPQKAEQVTESTDKVCGCPICIYVPFSAKAAAKNKS